MTEKTLNPKQHTAVAQKLSDNLNGQVVGQERAIQQFIRAYIPTTVNMHREGKPLGVFLFMGPTGVGKTELTRAVAKHLLGNRDALTRVDCTEFDASHEVSKLLGSPPGYVGYNEESRLTQKAIDKFQTKEAKVNIVLFDEIEKAHNRLFDCIMTILGDGRLTLGNGQMVDFTRTFIFLTSNLGSQEVRNMIEGRGIGFKRLSAGEREDLDERVYRMSKEAAKKQFRPEFINRLDSLVVFRSLSRESLRKILKIELDALQWRIWKSPWRGLSPTADKLPEGRSIVFHLSDEAKNFLLDEGTSEIYGARELNRAIDRFVGYPMAALIASEQLTNGEVVNIKHMKGDKDLLFMKKEKECTA